MLMPCVPFHPHEVLRLAMQGFIIQRDIQISAHLTKLLLHILMYMHLCHLSCFQVGDCNLRYCAATFFYRQKHSLSANFMR